MRPRPNALPDKPAAVDARRSPRHSDARSGSALIVALWVLLILAILIGAFAFDMHVEAGITAYYRKRIKAQKLAQAGVEYAKLLLKQSYESNAFEETDEEKEAFRQKAIALSRGNGITGLSRELGGGQFSVDILPEKGRRNINHLEDLDWEEILDQGNVPEEQWPELIDCINDWIDEGDEHRLNGAESDDPFYEERGYAVKNAPLDTPDELLLVKGFTPAVVYGGKDPEYEDVEYRGIAHLVTTWGEDDKVNVNTASREVLLTLPGITEEWMVDDIIRLRAGLDEIEGTKDDGFESVDDVVARTGITDPAFKEQITTGERKHVRIVSIGEVDEVRSGVWCIFDVNESGAKPIFWREESMP